MKRVIFAAIAACGILFGTAYKAEAQVEQGSFMIDPYVGFPTANMGWSLLNDIGGDNFSTVGPPVSFGARFEYMVADNFGLGLDGNYVKAGYSYTDPDYYGIDSAAVYSYSTQRIRVMLRLNYHFVQTENLDVYLGFGAGYKHVIRTAEWDEVADASISGALIPIAFRVAMGGRYYFHPNIGLNFELGLGGGGILQAGLAIKI